MDAKRIVAEGYDQVAQRYLTWSGLRPSPQRLFYLDRFIELVPPGAVVLELGCGAGIPMTQALAYHYQVTGVDISAAQVALARQHVPQATLIHADMVSLDFPPASFDAIAAFYSLTHVPRQEHTRLFDRIYTWLRPGGLLLATLGAGDSPDCIEDDWLGVPMFFSHFDAATNQRLVTAAGFQIVEASVVAEDEDGAPVTFLWVIATKGV